MSAVYWRIYGDYLMKNRFGLYRNILETAIAKGYEHLSMIQFYHLIKEGKLTADKKIFIHRHDIDTDKKGAAIFFEIEKSLCIKSSYYFRLSTLEIPLMKEINNYGSEASYHYEEIASYCKRNGILKPEQVAQHLAAIREEFKKNFTAVETNLGYKLRTVASHGDFVNRKLKIANHLLLQQELKDELGIVAEAYDPVFTENYSIKISDKEAPVYFAPTHPLEAIEKQFPVIYLLTHPRQWRTRFLTNTKDNLQRIKEGIIYQLSSGNYFGNI